MIVLCFLLASLVIAGEGAISGRAFGATSTILPTCYFCIGGGELNIKFENGGFRFDGPQTITTFMGTPNIAQSHSELQGLLTYTFNGQDGTAETSAGDLFGKLSIGLIVESKYNFFGEITERRSLNEPVGGTSPIVNFSNFPFLSYRDEAWPPAALPSTEGLTVNAGIDQTVRLATGAALDGTVIFAGMPSGTVHTTWSKVSGPGPVIFGNPNALDTPATFSKTGAYKLRLTANDDTLSAYDEVFIIVNTFIDRGLFDDGMGGMVRLVYDTEHNITWLADANFAKTSGFHPTGLMDWTTANSWAAGLAVGGFTDWRLPRTIQPDPTCSEQVSYPGFPDQGVQAGCAGNELSSLIVQLSPISSAVVSSAGYNIDKPEYPADFLFKNFFSHYWSQDEFAPETSRAWISPVGYNYQLTSAGGFENGFPSTQITWQTTAPKEAQTGAWVLRDGDVQNTPPVVTAGVAQTITLPSSAVLNGSATDDGLPPSPGTLTTTWTKVSGPGIVTFGNASSIDTTATFSLPSTYVLRLTANDGELTTSAEVTITVNPTLPPPPMNQAPSVNAGTAQTITLPGTGTLNGTVTDDGLPNPPGVVTIRWSKVSGPGVVTFGNPAAVDTTGSFTLPGTYVLRLTATDGALSTSADVTITVNNQGGRRQSSDVNGDGKADLVWRNSNGATAIWFMNGTAIASAGFPGGVPLKWQIAGVGDVNGDGKADVIWRHSTSGTVAIWLMNGVTITSVGFPGSAPPAWAIQAVGDVNGDGTADIVWRNTSSGAVSVWFMNGATITSAGFPPGVSLAWQVAGVGDVNGDGKADVIWRKGSSGTVAIWLMNGLTITSVGFPGTTSVAWKIEGVGDTNGDGKADLIWKNGTSGVVVIWLMDGATRASSGVVGGLASSWKIAQVGDVDGNGTADLVWRHSLLSAVEVWIMNGVTLTTMGSLGATSTDWEIQ
ncbi:MAG: FG-GAP-like repeat-containing protein [Nitrospirales bacterium]|nr:FG-GAP-like repeat-containing protein [Nitrospirales bacterium]